MEEVIIQKLYEIIELLSGAGERTVADNTNKNYSKLITELLNKIGVPANIKGYDYTKRAILLVLEKPDLIHFMTKGLYPIVANEYATTSSRVERAIRHSIVVACSNGNMKFINELFGSTMSYSKGKPTNSCFIATIAEYLRNL